MAERRPELQRSNGATAVISCGGLVSSDALQGVCIEADAALCRTCTSARTCSGSVCMIGDWTCFWTVGLQGPCVELQMVASTSRDRFPSEAPRSWDRRNRDLRTAGSVQRTPLQDVTCVLRRHRRRARTASRRRHPPVRPYALFFLATFCHARSPTYFFPTTASELPPCCC